MHVLITGAGSIGIAMCAMLKSAGAEVSVYARGETLRAVRTNGIRKTGLFGELEYSPDAFDVSDDYGSFAPNSFDFILICAKTMANDMISKELGAHRELLKKDGRLVILQNGWGNDIPYLRFFSQEQVCSARVITGFQRSAPNVSRVTVYTSPILLGNLYGFDPAPLQPLADAITRGGIPCETTPDVEKALWAKMLYNCTLNPLGAVLGVHYGALGECEHSVAIMNAVMDEIFAVMNAAGYSTYWPDADAYRGEFYAKLLPDTYNHNSSTLQDIRAQRRTEIDTLTGCILTLAQQHKIDVPVNTMLYRLVKSLEANFERGEAQ